VTIKELESIGGPVSDPECELLFELASKTTDGCIVEIGSYRGRSTVALALGSLAGHKAPVFAIEPHEPFVGVLGGKFGPADRSHFMTNVLAAGVTEIVRLVNLSSEVVTPGWRAPVGLLWIDGDHRYEAARRDYDCWEPFVIPGGLILFHDSLDPNLGPSRIIREISETGRFEIRQTVDLTTVLQKLK